MSIQQLASPVRTLENGHFTRAQALSLSLHIAIVALLLIPAAVRVVETTGIKPIFRTPLLPPPNLQPLKPTKLGQFGTLGGSGHEEPEPPSKGDPPPLNRIQLIKPGAIVNRESEVMLPPSVFGPDDVRFEHALKNWGVPNELEVNNKRGPGRGNGYGRGNGPGHGDFEGDGIGPDGNPYAGKHGQGFPTCAYCPNPPFTEEAIRVRYQGRVVLRGLVTADGRVTNISVVRGAGMGLDENAVAKVKTWRLTPARGPDGQPAPVWTLIEVIFRQH